jgi:O-antigen ligase
VLGGGTHADFQSIGLAGRNGRELLVNTDFAQGLARWFPAERFYFLPWHIDNLYLELLIERGVLGLVLWLLIVGTALWHLILGRARQQPLAPYLAASLMGVSLVGMVSSVMDVPRVAFLPYLLALCALCWARHADGPRA